MSIEDNNIGIEELIKATIIGVGGAGNRIANRYARQKFQYKPENLNLQFAYLNYNFEDLIYLSEVITKINDNKTNPKTELFFSYNLGIPGMNTIGTGGDWVLAEELLNFEFEQMRTNIDQLYFIPEFNEKRVYFDGFETDYEDNDDFKPLEQIIDSNVVLFISALGEGTGTGATPILLEKARDARFIHDNASQPLGHIAVLPYETQIESGSLDHAIYSGLTKSMHHADFVILMSNSVIEHTYVQQFSIEQNFDGQQNLLLSIANKYILEIIDSLFDALMVTEYNEVTSLTDTVRWMKRYSKLAGNGEFRAAYIVPCFHQYDLIDEQELDEDLIVSDKVQNIDLNLLINLEHAFNQPLVKSIPSTAEAVVIILNGNLGNDRDKIEETVKLADKTDIFNYRLILNNDSSQDTVSILLLLVEPELIDLDTIRNSAISWENSAAEYIKQNSDLTSLHASLYPDKFEDQEEEETDEEEADEKDEEEKEEDSEDET